MKNITPNTKTHTEDNTLTIYRRESDAAHAPKVEVTDVSGLGFTLSSEGQDIGTVKVVTVGNELFDVLDT